MGLPPLNKIYTVVVFVGEIIINDINVVFQSFQSFVDRLFKSEHQKKHPESLVKVRMLLVL
ncbi:hypothetical protein C7R94_02445 [Brevibacillus sp. NRRL NRS-603]|nr:hypothetical protein [Brevibacillus formosus]PSK20952.1 hypothetical protein C7R94_02445 [Brevibacillus sp. NRRL NRS-603]